jgi:large repetitive protein
VQNVTDYQYNGIVVTVLNDVPIKGETIPPAIMVSATPKRLWPPNHTMVPVTVSGTIKDIGGTGVNLSTAAYVVRDEYGLVQPAGTVTLDLLNGSYSFTIQLQASRKGDDEDGRQYHITVSAEDNAGNKGSSSTLVIVPHDQRNDRKHHRKHHREDDREHDRKDDRGHDQRDDQDHDERDDRRH